MEWKVTEVLFTDLQLKTSLEKALTDLTSAGFQIHSMHTTFNSIIVVASKKSSPLPGEEYDR